MNDGRDCLDSIVITQLSSQGGPSPLATPSFVMTSAVTDTGFALSWTGDANAAGYEIYTNGAVAGTCVNTSTNLTGLTSDTLYSVQVKALAAAGSTDYSHSGLSDPVSVRTTLSGGMVRATLFEENFSTLDNPWSGSSYLADEIGTFTVEEKNWLGHKVARRRHCVSVGTGTDAGFLQSRDISLTNNLLSGTATVSFYVVTPTTASTPKQATVRLFVIDAETGETNAIRSLTAPVFSGTSATDITTEGAFFEEALTALPERFLLRFEPVWSLSSDEKRFAIDAVKVTQTYLPLPALAAPAPAFDETQSTSSSLAASWTAVANAANYAVELRDADTGDRVSLVASQAGTSAAFTGLEAYHEYAVRVRALGDGAATANSPWSAAGTARTLVDVNAPTFTASEGAGDAVMATVEKTFSVTAARDGVPIAVAFEGLSPAAAGASWSSPTFSWTPTDADAGANGTSYTARFSTDNGAYHTNIAFVVTARPPLADPVITNTVIGVKNAEFAWDIVPQPRAASYAVRLWRGTSDYRNPVCFEDFGDNGVMPDGWTGIDTEWYLSSDYTKTRVKFAKDGAALISKLHSAPVTNLSFHTRSSSTSPTSDWSLYASRGGVEETDWVHISTSTILTTPKATPITRTFDASNDYRRFKWVYTKRVGTLGIGNIAAAHEGASAIFTLGTVETPVDMGATRTLSVPNLRAGREYFLEVTVTGDDGTTKSDVLRFSTKPANKATVLVVK